MIGPKAIIHLDRLIHNYQLVKQKTGNKQIMAFVKANAYGHGAVPVAKALESVGADWFGVFTPGEAIELRKGGGTHGEVAIAYHYNIPVYLVNTLPFDELSGWIFSCSTEMFTQFAQLKKRLSELYG